MAPSLYSLPPFPFICEQPGECLHLVGRRGFLCGLYVRWSPHPVIVMIRGNKDYIRVLLYSYCTTITGWGVLLIYMQHLQKVWVSKKKPYNSLARAHE